MEAGISRRTVAEIKDEPENPSQNTHDRLATNTATLLSTSRPPPLRPPPLFADSLEQRWALYRLRTARPHWVLGRSIGVQQYDLRGHVEDTWEPGGSSHEGGNVSVLLPYGVVVRRCVATSIGDEPPHSSPAGKILLLARYYVFVRGRRILYGACDRLLSSS